MGKLCSKLKEIKQNFKSKKLPKLCDELDWLSYKTNQNINDDENFTKEEKAQLLNKMTDFLNIYEPTSTLQSVQDLDRSNASFVVVPSDSDKTNIIQNKSNNEPPAQLSHRRLLAENIDNISSATKMSPETITKAMLTFGGQSTSAGLDSYLLEAQQLDKRYQTEDGIPLIFTAQVCNKCKTTFTFSSTGIDVKAELTFALCVTDSECNVKYADSIIKDTLSFHFATNGTKWEQCECTSSIYKADVSEKLEITNINEQPVYSVTYSPANRSLMSRLFKKK